MRYCPKCGVQVALEDVFCPYCGKALPSAPAELSTPQDSAQNGEDEPETVFNAKISLSETQNDEIGSPNSEYKRSSNPTPIQSETIGATAIPNYELESIAHETGDVPFEEIRESEADLAEDFDFQPASSNEPESSPENFFGEQNKAANSESSDFAQSAVQTADEQPEPSTLISHSLAPKPEPPESTPLLSNPDDVSVPRPTESNQPKDTPGAKSPKLKPLSDGTLLNNRYEIVRKIGGGGMGAVYLARDRNLGGVERAVKEMIQAYVDESQHEKAVEDFRREAILLSSLEHPAIPTIYDYFVDESENRFYLVMKYISGGDLAGRFRAAPDGLIDERTMTEWAIQIADVLDYLHNLETPIVYRDLKPSNIMIDGKNGRVMLVDFGIARWVNKEEKGVTAVGTMGYAPSEQYAGNAEPRSDIYALGATMFHLLTGSDPQNNPLMIFDFTKHPRPRQINPDISVEMEKILIRAVEYNANNRFASAAEMRDRLLDHLERIRAGRLTFAAPETVSRVSSVEPTFVQPQAAPTMAFCGFCGERIASNDMFCAYCGSKQPEAARVQAIAQTVFPSNKTTALLVVEYGIF